MRVSQAPGSSRQPPPALAVWLSALQHRHRAALTSTEFLKALRALSARYVERRSQLRDRSPLDSAGKRAAFAAFYAPQHFLTTWEIVRALGSAGANAGGSEDRAIASLASIVDLGCGTGAVSAAWALAQGAPPSVTGVDANAWALAESRWNWRQLEVRGACRRSDLVAEAERLAHTRAASLAGTGVVAGWSVNELDDRQRRRLLPALLSLAKAHAAVLIVEPIARSAVPWWDEWAAAFAGAGGRADEWRFDAALPAVLAELDEAAGFRRRGLTARSLAAGL